MSSIGPIPASACCSRDATPCWTSCAPARRMPRRLASVPSSARPCTDWAAEARSGWPCNTRGGSSTTTPPCCSSVQTTPKGCSATSPPCARRPCSICRRMRSDRKPPRPAPCSPGCSAIALSLIVANVDTEAADQAVETLLQQLFGGHVLITRRLSNRSGAVEALPLDALKPAAAVDFLLARTDARRRAGGRCDTGRHAGRGTGQPRTRPGTGRCLHRPTPPQSG